MQQDARQERIGQSHEGHPERLSVPAFGEAIEVQAGGHDARAAARAVLIFRPKLSVKVGKRQAGAMVGLSRKAGKKT